MASVVFTRAKGLFIRSSLNWPSTSHEFGVLLATDDYIPKAHHRFVSEVVGELRGHGYQRQTLAGREVVVNYEKGIVECHAKSVVFDDLATRQTYRWLVIFRSGARDSRSDLIVAFDMGRVDLNPLKRHTVFWGALRSASGCVFRLG